MTTDPATRERLLRAFTQQRLWCEESSPFMAELMACTADWLRGVAPENGPMGPAAMGAASACGALAGISNDPLAAAVPLRWAAGLHGLALAGLQPWASLWPSTRGATTPAPGRASLFAAIEHAWATQRSAVLLALRHAPQTNEVMRSAVLLPGLLQAQARHPDLPITLLELGSSAGLNLLLDRWRYEWHGQWPLEPAAASNPHGQAGPLVATWGLENAGLTLRSTWRGALGNTERDRPWTRALGSRPPVVRRLGCDVQPLLLAGRPGAAGCADAADTVGAADCRALGQVEADAVALRLQSFVWADQHDRLERLRQAIGFARSAHCPEFEVRQQSALSFVQQELAALPRAPGLRVLMHSVVWQYLGAEEQSAVRSVIEQAGEHATPQTPLAWLRMEPPAPELQTELRLRCWPGGEDVRLARCHAHGRWIEWCAADSALEAGAVVGPAADCVAGSASGPTSGTRT